MSVSLVGVLALQGDYGTHRQALSEIGIEAIEVRRPEDAGFLTRETRLANGSTTVMVSARRPVWETGGLAGTSMGRERSRTVTMRPTPDALVLPGGESSTIDLLGRRYGIDHLLSAYAASGKTIFGTCAGAIWLGRGTHHKVTPLGLIDVTVERNAYGRQLDSFIAPIDVRGLSSPFEAVFIRAPKIVDVGQGVEVLARHDRWPVLVRKGNIWLATFHPERSQDRRLHRLIFDGVES